MMVKFNQNLAYLDAMLTYLIQNSIFRTFDIHFDEVNGVVPKLLHDRSERFHFYLYALAG